MADLDPSIILGAGNIQGPNSEQQTQGLVSMFSLAQAIKQQKQQDASQNALRQIFSNPDSVDPTTGLPNQKAISGVMAVDPTMGIKLQDASLDAQVKKLQMQHSATERGKTKFDFMSQVAGVATDAYKEAKVAGKPDEDALAAGTAARNAAAKNGGGLVGDDTVDGILGTPFDPKSAEALARTNKDWVEQQDKRESLARQDAAEKEREKHDAALEGLAARGQNIRVETGEGSKWQVLTDPTQKDGKGNPVQYRYNPETGQSTTLDASAPFKPGGAAKIGGGGSGASFTPEMGALMAATAEQGVSLPTGFRSKDQQIQLYKGLLDRNPDKTPDEIAKMLKTGQIEFGAQKKETQTAAGIAGKVEVAANELSRFVPLVRSASADLKRSNIKSLNQLVQTADSQLSDPKLKTLKGYIVGTLNAYDVLGSRGGTDAEKRAENRQQLLSAEGDGAINAALDVMLKEADIAHQSSVEATRVPELDNPDKKQGATGGAKILRYDAQGNLVQ